MHQCLSANVENMLRNVPDSLIAALYAEEKVPYDVWYSLLLSRQEEREELASLARKVSESVFGNRVYVRALLEISSYCRNNCRYCGLRCANVAACRYRLSKDEVLDSCRRAARLGFNTFVLQGGEDPAQDDDWLADVVSSIRKEFPEKAITLSVGERTYEGYARLRASGADRYLLRHETADKNHYCFLHPHTMSFENRHRCLRELKSLGYQVGSGMMVGSPGQAVEHLVKDLMFLDELKPQMIGIGPFVPATGTPFAEENNGNTDMTLLLISILRLRFRSALIPATTALATLCKNGTERGILAGANVVMPNVTPLNVRDKYAIYDNKKNCGTESAEQLDLLHEKLEKIGYCIDFSRGDYKYL